jgi:hypothetical protein
VKEKLTFGLDVGRLLTVIRGMDESFGKFFTTKQVLEW